MKRVNILTRYDFPLFAQHIGWQRNEDGIEIVENGEDDREWDLVIVFDGMPAARTLRVRAGGLVFIAGEPPDAISYTRAFLSQFDRSFCAHPKARRRATNEPDQYFNNWHFGQNGADRTFRWSYAELRDLPPPTKTKDVSVIMSSLAYMPNHLKRLHFLERLQERFGERVDVYGRGHRFIAYKDEALLPYRFHVCIENCAVPDLWTEKLADPFLGWAVPVYAGCTNVDRYFPDGSFVRLNMDDVGGSLTTIARLLGAAAAEYQLRFHALRLARERVLGEFNIGRLVERLLAAMPKSNFAIRKVIPNEQTRGHALGNHWLRARRAVYRRYFQLSRDF